MNGEFVENAIVFLVIIFAISYMVRKKGINSFSDHSQDNEPENSSDTKESDK